MRLALTATVLFASCAPAGTLVSPDGIDDLRTMMYRVGIRHGAPELVIVLSNGELACGLPNYADTASQAEAVEALLAATCREGARHVALHLYHAADRWTGTYPGVNGASADLLGAETRRVAKGAYYAVDEAFLVEIDGLERGYAAAEDTWIPEFGDGGEVVIEAEGESELEGWFAFPREQLSGDFRATRCWGDTSLLDVLAAQPVHYCQ